MRHAILASLVAFSLGAARAQEPTPPEQAPAPQQPPQQPPPQQPPPQQPQPPEAAPQGQPTVTAGVDWFPLETNRRWKYRVRMSIESTAADADAPPPESNEHLLEVFVVGPTKLDDKDVIEVEWKVDTVLSMRDFYAVNAGVVTCLKRIQGFGEHMKEYVFDRPQVTARQDMPAGDGWQWEGKAGTTQGSQTFKVLRQERIEVPAGTFDALVVQIEFQGEDESRGTTTRWLARGVGIVKEESEIRTPSQVFRTSGLLDRKWAPGE